MWKRICLTTGLFLAIGCERDDQIVTYSAPKDPKAAPATLPVAAPETSVDLKYALPGGWQEIDNPSPMRFATIKAGEAELIITRLAAGTWGDLLGNINRWRGQVGLAPITDANEQKPEIVERDGKSWTTYEITGPEKKMIVTFVTVDQSVWFFRLGGTEPAVASQRQSFDSFLQSLKFN